MVRRNHHLFSASLYYTRDMDKKPVRIYYDGTCKMCTAFAAGVEKRSPEQELIDATGALDGNEPASRERLLTEVHLVEGDGTVRTGPDAIMTSLSYTYPILTPIKCLTRIPPFSWVARLIYRLVAKHRHSFMGHTDR